MSGLMRDVLLLLSTILYDLWFKLSEYLMRECEKGIKRLHIKNTGSSEYKHLKSLAYDIPVISAWFFFFKLEAL